jgi:hypothetical protein
MAETPEIKLTINLGNAIQQTESFAQALSRVDQKARGIFVTLRELSQRHQQQGFLGMADQRALEQGVRQWERATEIMGLRRAGAQARLSEVGPDAGIRTTQAEQVLTRLTQHQQGLSALRQVVGNVFGGNIPGPTQAWYPGYGLQYTAAPPPGFRSRGFAGPGFGPGDMRGYASAAGPGARARGVYGPEYESAAGLGARARGFYGPGLGPGDMGGYASAAGPGARARGVYGPEYESAAALGRWTYGRPYGPEYESAAGPGRPSRGRFYGPGFGPDDLSGMRGSGFEPPRGGGGGGGGGGRMGGWLGGMVGRAGGFALGYGAYQLLNMGMESYNERFRGVLQTGLMLDTQYKRLDQTVLHLGDTYQITRRKALDALRTMGAATGTDVGTIGAMRVGRAYDMEDQAAGFAGSLALLGTNRHPNLAQLTGQYNQFVRGRALISRPRFVQAAIDVAAVGGLQAAPLSEGDYGMIAQRMVAMGGRYQADPGGAYAQEFAGFQSPAGALGTAVRQQGISDVAARQQWVRLGNRWVNLRDPMGRLIAEQQAAQIPEIRQGIFGAAQRMAGGNTGLGMTLFGEAAGIDNAMQAADRYQAERAIAEGRGPRRADLGQEESAIDRTLREQKDLEESSRGLRLRNEEMNKQRTDEIELIDKIKAAQQNLLDTGIKVNETYKETNSVVAASAEVFKNLNKEVMAIAGFVGVVSGNPALMAVGAALIAGAMAKDLAGPPGGPAPVPVGPPGWGGGTGEGPPLNFPTTRQPRKSP